MTQKRALVKELAAAYPLQKVCAVLELPRSTYYYQAQPAPDEAGLKARIQAVAGRWPTYGYRRITVQLRREYQLVVNSKRGRRLMHELGIAGEQPRKKKHTTDSNHPYPRYPNLVTTLEITGPDQVWVADITYIRLQDEFIYLAVLLDVFTRSIRGWHLGRNLDQELTLTALRRALRAHCTVRQFIMRIKAYSMPRMRMWRCCARTLSKLVWPKSARRGKMAMPNG